MSVSMKTAEEIASEQFAAHFALLRAERKAKEAAIKELTDNLKRAEADSVRQLAEIKARTEARRIELVAVLAPLEAKRHLIAELDAEFQKRKRLVEEETASLKAERNAALGILTQQTAREKERFDAITNAIASCKDKVAAL
jgi:hypothetical protein